MLEVEREEKEMIRWKRGRSFVPKQRAWADGKQLLLLHPHPPLRAHTLLKELLPVLRQNFPTSRGLEKLGNAPVHVLKRRGLMERTEMCAGILASQHTSY